MLAVHSMVVQAATTGAVALRRGQHPDSAGNSGGAGIPDGDGDDAGAGGNDGQGAEDEQEDDAPAAGARAGGADAAEQRERVHKDEDFGGEVAAKGDEEGPRAGRRDAQAGRIQGPVAVHRIAREAVEADGEAEASQTGGRDEMQGQAAARQRPRGDGVVPRHDGGFDEVEDEGVGQNGGVDDLFVRRTRRISRMFLCPPTERERTFNMQRLSSGRWFNFSRPAS